MSTTHAGDDAHAPAPEQDPHALEAVQLAERLRGALERQGVAPRHQATVVAELCDLSVSQARRKLHGAAWLFSEVQVLAAYCGVPLDDLAQGEPGPEHPQASQAGSMLLEGAEHPCEVVIGHLLAPKDLTRTTLQALREGSRWLVGPPAVLQRLRPQAPRYAVVRAVITPQPSRHGLRVAVVDDDPHAADSLCDWFDEAGGKGQSFASAAALLGTDLMQFDAFVVDYILGSGQNAEALIEHLRAQRPLAPIALLTGRLRDGTACEDALTALMRSLKVMFFEKPVRPAVLTAALLNSLDRSGSQLHD